MSSAPSAPSNPVVAENSVAAPLAAIAPAPAPAPASSSSSSSSPVAPVPLVEPAKPKAPLSGYFLFLAAHRTSVKAANPTLGIGPIGKLLGKMWGELGDADKAQFTDKASTAKALYVEKIKEWKKEMAEFVAKGGVPTSTNVDNSDPRLPVMPLARIKKIMKMDPDVHNMSKEALFLMTKMTDLFLEHLGEASIKQAHGQKRKSVRVEDINSAIRATSSARFLEADFPITGPSDHKRTKLNDASLEQVVAGPMDSFLNKKKESTSTASTSTASSEKKVVAGNAVEKIKEVVEKR